MGGGVSADADELHAAATVEDSVTAREETYGRWRELRNGCEPTHTRCLLNAQISSHEQFVHQLPAVGSCVFAGQRPRGHVCPVVNFCCVLYKGNILESNTEKL